MKYIQLEDQFASGMYHKRPLVITRGYGSRVWDETGREYIDCTSGIGVANLGHAHPVVREAIKAQSEKLITCHELFYNDQRALLLEKLNAITPANINKFFFCNSGTEAIEGALKFARMSTGRTEVICFMRAYHGKTFGSLSASWEKTFRDPFEPLLPGFRFIPFDNPEAAEQAISENTGAVIVEIVQGDGGVRPGSTEFFHTLRKLCDRARALLIVDEVQTGIGRTGKMFALEHHDFEPDIITLAKGIAGGLPMGVIAFNHKVKIVTKLAHTTTFGGNPLVCAVACAVLNYMTKENIPKKAERTGEYFFSGLRKIPSKKIRQIRGLGLMIGIELKEKAGPYAQKLIEEGVLVLLAGQTVLRLLPPLIIEKNEIDIVIEKLCKVLE